MSSTILRVGLTGNIASGKSSVARWLVDFGCRVADLDAVAHECMRRGEATYDAVIRAFGDDILRTDGTIDRARLGAVVFADERARRLLEDILHPAIRERERRLVEQIAASYGSGIVVTEAALLYETGGADRYHRMVVVTAPDEIRLHRLEARGLTPAEARQRMASQMDQERKAQMADYVIDNSGSLEEAREKSRLLAGMLRRDLMRQMAGEPLGKPLAPP